MPGARRVTAKCDRDARLVAGGWAGRATWPLTRCPRARAPLPQNLKRRAALEPPIQRPDQAPSRQ